ncbi:NAD-dependent deacylase [Pseudomonas sp. ZM23]|uniref:NAD-dependent protein deacylase n=1 Tax=Pseudomonas triclosanedens TaxID=2961893 RepID=A0ABY6ZS84_9PSED|nr:NAD-dependent deacylase [Pseudomonas triclosanedens]MCP8467080.1 NAD-dependent deacylase [Pseudomonas triclosanedens]MCP8472771.1 NAD-dependent deacylase [Pseudomonas triclosanedens]MCP8478202.1 NAD-dependent deacylase [Pseudomonas triclosanedens]WAI47608.1 NAD-dependent deacylase [Pseudomonas triclosanedens]
MMFAEELLDTLRQARHVVVFTGAGVSAESGIPTFRDRLDGLWSRLPPATLATTAAFRADPSLVWGWYQWRRTLVHRAQPNPAHRAIAELAGMVPQLTLITQNVDDLHERAGSQDVIHLHGQLERPRCFTCGREPGSPLPAPDEPQAGRHVIPPACEHCGGPLRPGVVWFGESLPADALSQAFHAAEQCDLLISVGTSGVVYPAAEIPQVAWRMRATVLHVNPQPGPLHGEREFALASAAGVALPALLDAAFAG